jgi:NAD(P)-dependent dehydrogenase (short-subunit alcohol dehydrogenase family)
MDGLFSLEGKTALVTGGSRGLGREIALAYAHHGADVIVTSRKLEACEQTAAEIEALGRRAFPVACHVGHWEEIDALLETVYAEFERVDILVNNAGMSPIAPSSVETEEALLDKVLAVNFKGPFRLGALVGERMVAAGGGAIINVSSYAAQRAKPLFGPYAASKAGMNALTQVFALEYGPTVRVNTLSAGPFLTDIAANWPEEARQKTQSAIGRPGQPEEVVTTALFLASPHSTFVTGGIVRVDGGLV